MARVQEIVRHDGQVVRRKPRAGDMQWDGERWRRFNGKRFVTAVYSRDPESLKQPQRPDLATPVPAPERRGILMKAVEDQVIANGASVVFDGRRGVVLGYRRRPSPGLLDLLLVLVTFGLWFVAMILRALAVEERRVLLTVDDWGHVWATPVASSA
jgi:hypothetical protein